MILRKNLDLRIQRKLNLTVIVEFSTAQEIEKANRINKLLKDLRRQALNKDDSEYSVKDRLLYRKDKLYVLNKNELRKTLIQKIYEHSIVDYSEIQRTKVSVQRNYYWPEIKKLMKRYVKNCQVCSRFKALRDRYNGLL